MLILSILAPRIAQVIRGWKSSTPPGTQFDNGDLQALQHEIEQFFNGAEHKCQDVAKKVRFPNKLVILSWDNALRACLGRSLMAFRPRKRLIPLEPGVSRHYVDIAQLPESLRRPGATRRVCLKDGAGKTSLELPVQLVEEDDAIHLRIDQGSIGWPAAVYLYTEVGVNELFLWDVCHHIHNEWQNGLKAGQVWLFMLELVVALNLSMGPWKGSAWFWTTKQAMEEFLVNTTCETPFSNVCTKKFVRTRTPSATLTMGPHNTWSGHTPRSKAPPSFN